MADVNNNGTGGAAYQPSIMGGYTGVTYKGQQVLGNSPLETSVLQNGVDTWKAATGQSLSLMDYDKMANPTTYGARWNVDGTSADTGSQPFTGITNAMAPAPAPAGAPAASAPAASSSTTPTGQPYSPWDVTPSQTVEQRIQSIVNGGAPLVAQGRANAIDQMNARGLSDSSLATSASDAAAYQVALPIAQADAATAAKAAGYNADIQNQMGMQGRQLTTQEKIAAQQSETQKSIAQLNSETQKYTANLDATTRTTLQTLQNQNSTLIQTNQQAASMFNQAVAAISQIQGNDKMDAATKTAAIAQIMQNTNTQLKALSTSSGVNVQINLANYPGFDAQGNYVGFGNGTTNAANSTSGGANPFTNINVNTQ